MSVAPHPGPPTPDGSLYQRPSVEWKQDDGLLVFSSFTTRRYLIDTERVSKNVSAHSTDALPVEKTDSTVAQRKGDCEHLGEPYQNRTGGECVFAERISIHHTRGHFTVRVAVKPFEDALPEIIQRIERGEFPEQQAGHYNLKLELWQSSGA